VLVVVMVSVVMMAMVMMAVVVVMPVMVMMVMMRKQHQLAVTMSVEQVVVVMADDPRAVMMKPPGLARSRTANDEHKRGHRREQRFPEHKFLRLMMSGRRSNIPPGHAHNLPVRSARRCDPAHKARCACCDGMCRPLNNRNRRPSSATRNGWRQHAMTRR
jgi:hypothetical protein